MKRGILLDIERQERKRKNKLEQEEQIVRRQRLEEMQRDRKAGRPDGTS